jgi:hypothetical protein
MSGLPTEEEELWRDRRTGINDGIGLVPALPRERTFSDLDLAHPLLIPLSRAQHSVTRLETAVAAASDAVAEGIRARMAYAEAAGWLAHVSTWIDPNELAVRDSGLRGAYIPALRKAILKAPAATVDEFEPVSPKRHIAAALRFATQWRRLAEFTTWRPLADVASVRETVDSIAWRSYPILDGDIEEWLTYLGSSEMPGLILAGVGAREWMNAHVNSEPLELEAMFLAACIWREKGIGRPISQPFWSAASSRHYRLSSAVGMPWLAGFLECVAEAAQSGRHELDKLLRIEQKSAAFKRTARSHLPTAITAVIRAPVTTASGLARRLGITHQGALGLLRELMQAGIVKEATGRGAWRAFITV